VNELHSDTGRPVIGTPIPDLPRPIELVKSAAPVLSDIRTQSWDIALSDQGPGFLEVNFGADLRLAQLANGKGSSTTTTPSISGSSASGSDDPKPLRGKTRRSQVRPAQPGA
jgi:hypothetical protein